mgnify:CR=1 FL=1
MCFPLSSDQTGNMENASNKDNSDRSSDNGLLELSCASSSFDGDAFPSNSACKNSEVEPFRFEPRVILQVKNRIPMMQSPRKQIVC